MEKLSKKIESNVKIHLYMKNIQILMYHIYIMYCDIRICLEHD